jgi:glyoxylase-like metal-dependent hydrolase (beta-lactamase superfamily II)/rhodanese-related sulfurtransferase
LFFRQVLYRDLGCASYMLGDDGEAIVIDPRWDIEEYLELARAERLRIVHVVDTHDHADHVSGRVRLANATGARAHRPSSPTEARDDRIEAGDEIEIGDVRLRAIATPGHRPEHLAFAVSDLSRGAEPWLVLTGDSLLVGDIARPDLVLDAAEGAETLHASLQPLLSIGDHVEVWPAHVGGSLCGGAGLNGKTSSTIGFERHHNPMLMMDQGQFVAALTETLPTRPPNVDRVVFLNRLREDHDPGVLEPLDPQTLSALLAGDLTVLDGRPPVQFDREHLVDALNLPLASPGVGTRAGWALDSEERIVIAASDPEMADAMASALNAVGLWRIEGYTLGGGGRWGDAGLPVAEAGSWDLAKLAEGLREAAVELVDVRESSEWVGGHVRGSHHVPLHRLRDAQSVQLPDRGRTTAVACAAGARAAFAASLLRRAGRRDVVRVSGGGVGDLGAHGIPLDIGLD